MGLFAFGTRRRSIGDVAALADFIDEQTAFLVQKGIFEYSRARAAHFAKFLFSEPTFLALLERARWQGYPIGLAMVGEVTEAVVGPHLRGGVAAGDRLDGLAMVNDVVLSVFDRYEAPAALDPGAWQTARATLVHDLDLVGIHPPKMAKDIPERFVDAYVALMPIHEKLRQHEGPTIRNYLRVSLCNIHEELTKRLDAPALAASLRASAA